MAHHRYIVERLIEAIQKPDYQPPRPLLRRWDKLLNWKLYHARNSFFEWMGDSLLSAALSVELCRRVPDGNEGVFTAVRSALASNLTFAYIIHKMGVSRQLVHPADSCYKRLPVRSKHFSDLFEVIVAEVYRTYGFEALCVWIGDVFSPLIQLAIDVHKKLSSRAQAQSKKVKLRNQLLKAKLNALSSRTSSRKYYRNSPRGREPLHRRNTPLLKSRLGVRDVPIAIEMSEADNDRRDMMPIAESGSSTDPICISDSDSDLYG